MAFDQSFIMELKARCDVESVISSYVNLKRSSRNLVGLCPFHNEKTPSFTVYPEQNSFYCFGCQASGDVITFIRRIENLDYVEAVRFLAQRAGMSMPEDNFDNGQSQLKAKILEINRAAAKFFHNNLATPQGAQALSYLRSRGLKDETIRHFGLGYANDSWDTLIKHLRSCGYSNSDILAADLAASGRNGSIYDRFRDRVMFPIIDLRGSVVGFTGRILNDNDKQKGKYVNTSQTPVFKKNQQIYALNFAKNGNNGKLILCEGNMDVISMHQAGFTNAVAAMGTAFNDEHARILSHYCDEVIIAGDNDIAGQKAVEKQIGILRNAGLTVKVLVVPQGKDADEFLRENGESGRAVFANLIENAQSDMDFKLNKSMSAYDMDSAEGRIQYSKDAINILCDLDNSLEREIYAAKVAQQLHVTKDSILLQASSALKRRRKAKEKQYFRDIQLKTGGYGDKINPEKAKYLRASRAEEQLISILLQNPDYISFYKAKDIASQFLTSFNKYLLQEILSSIENGYTQSEDIITDLNRVYDPEQITAINLIASLRSANGLKPGNDTPEEIDSYIDILKQEKEKISPTAAAELSINDAAAAFENIKKSKLRSKK